MNPVTLIVARELIAGIRKALAEPEPAKQIAALVRIVSISADDPLFRIAMLQYANARMAIEAQEDLSLAAAELQGAAAALQAKADAFGRPVSPWAYVKQNWEVFATSGMLILFCGFAAGILIVAGIRG